MSAASPRAVAVVGGGLAGITAALRLADSGASVTLLESSARLGGVAGSFRRGDLEVDTGQHVFMRCCTAYRSLLERLGVTGSTTMQDRMQVKVVRARDGRRAQLSRQGLPVLAGLPLHLGRSLAGYSVLSAGQRAAAVRATLALRSVDPADPATDEQSFGAWLAAHGQPPATVEALWDLVGVATLNARADEASLALAATVFQLGLLTDPGAADLAWSRVPLGRLHGEAGRSALDAAGVEVLTRARVGTIEVDGAGWRILAGDVVVAADTVVLATEPEQAERLLPAEASGLSAGWSERLGAMPIVNVHAVFDRTVMTEDFLACIGSPLQWLFDRTVPSGLGRGQYIAASLSAADGIATLPVAELRERLLPEFARVLPAVRDAELLDFFITREPHATFRQAPGSARWRPGTATRHPGLVLAGAHTATGWPATMESAVRSGDAAAAALAPHLRNRTGHGVAA